jgi:hypothetical protein
MPTDREERLKEELKESATISPKTGKGNKVHFSLLRSTMLTFKRLSLILSDAAECDFVGEAGNLLLTELSKS